MNTRPKEIPHLDLHQVEALQSELLAHVDRLTTDPDRDRQQATLRAINDCSERLRECCEALEARARAFTVDQRGQIEVKLTDDQRAELKRRTGVDLATLHIEDEGASLMSAMPSMTREDIFELALRHAEGEALKEKARLAARAELDRITADLRDAPEQIRRELDRLLADPEFRKAFEAPSRK